VLNERCAFVSSAPSSMFAKQRIPEEPRTLVATANIWTGAKPLGPQLPDTQAHRDYFKLEKSKRTPARTRRSF
jgi:hypothetical protein